MLDAIILSIIVAALLMASGTLIDAPTRRKQGGFIGDILGSVAGPILGGIIGSESAGQQQQGFQQAGDTALQIFNQGQANVAPWLAAGKNALAAQQTFSGLNPDGTLNMMAPGIAKYDPSMFAMDPSYQWTLGQGQNAILNNASAMGGTFSGNTARALDQYTQGLASTQWQNALNNYNNWQDRVFGVLNTMSGTGAAAGSGIAQIGQTAASNIGSAQARAAQAGAYGTQAIGNAVGGAVNNMLPYLLGSGGAPTIFPAAGALPFSSAGSLAGSSGMFDMAGSFVPII